MCTNSENLTLITLSNFWLERGSLSSGGEKQHPQVNRGKGTDRTGTDWTWGAEVVIPHSVSHSRAAPGNVKKYVWKT